MFSKPKHANCLRRRAHWGRRIFLLLALAASAPAFCAVALPHPVVIASPDAPAPVLCALDDFCRDARAAGIHDIDLVTAVPPAASSIIIAGIAGQSTLLDDAARRARLDLSSLSGAWESFAIIPVTNVSPHIDAALLIAGSDARGTVYGVYEASERLFGTDPQYFWTGHCPEPITTTVWAHASLWSAAPAFRYRALYFNDEDQLAGWKGAQPMRALDDETCERLFESILRLRGNVLAPPVHLAPFTPAQYARARARGLLIVGTTGFEALRGAPGLTWPEFSRAMFNSNLPYSYSLYPTEVESFWTAIVRANRDVISIWPVGMRGTRDWPFWMDDPAAPTSMVDRARFISRVIQRQQAILDRECGLDPARPFIFTMRNEGLELYQTGQLVLPPTTILVWDDWPKIGRIRALPSARESAHPGGNGIYYHLTSSQAQWIQHIPPALIAEELTRAFRAGVNSYVRFNVGDLREFLLSTAAAMDIAWRTPHYLEHPHAPRVFTEQWCARHVGRAFAAQTADLYERLFDLENRCRSTSIVEALAPYVTTQDLYDLWDALSVHRLAQQADTPLVLAFYGRLINLDRLPRRLWPVSRSLLQALHPAWEELYSRARAVHNQLPVHRRQFFSDNLLLQIETARQLNTWALHIFDAFDLAAAHDYTSSADAFERAADAMEAIARARAGACHGQWTNWYRGEELDEFTHSLWTLKPHRHAGDARACAALARHCATNSATLIEAPLVPDKFDVSRDTCPLFAPIVTLPNACTTTSIARAWLCGVVLDCPPEAAPAVRIGTHVHPLPASGEPRRRIFCLPVPPTGLLPQPPRIEFSVNGPAEDKSLAFAVANLFLALELSP